MNIVFSLSIQFRFTRVIVFSIFPAPKKSINDEIVLITGSGGTLGRALAVEFSKYGAFLCLWDTDEVENQKTYELLYTQYNHRRMVAMKVDITFVIFIILFYNISLMFKI
jgi:FlaA1/EpsC-like NDP-sugar epimerase